MKVLTHLAHPTYQTNLSKIPGVEFYHMTNTTNFVKAWDSRFPQPSNIFTISEEEAKETLKDFDVLLMHQHPCLQQYKDWKIRKIFIEHTAPYPLGNQASFWAPKRAEAVDVTVFITKSNMRAWGMKQDARNTMIRHAINVNMYPNYTDSPENFVMTTVNAFIERDWCCGYGIWTKVTWPFSDTRVYGFGNENLGKKYAKGFYKHTDVVDLLTKAGVYFNPAPASPIPMSLMEAMAVGTPIVTVDKYEAGLLMKDKKHGIVSSNIHELQDGIKFMLANQDVAREMGQNARELVHETFPFETFISKWQKVLRIN